MCGVVSCLDTNGTNYNIPIMTHMHVSTQTHTCLHTYMRAHLYVPIVNTYTLRATRAQTLHIHTRMHTCTHAHSSSHMQCSTVSGIHDVEVSATSSHRQHCVRLPLQDRPVQWGLAVLVQRVWLASSPHQLARSD